MFLIILLMLALFAGSYYILVKEKEVKTVQPTNQPVFQTVQPTPESSLEPIAYQTEAPTVKPSIFEPEVQTEIVYTLENLDTITETLSPTDALANSNIENYVLQGDLDTVVEGTLSPEDQAINDEINANIIYV